MIIILMITRNLRNSYHMKKEREEMLRKLEIDCSASEQELNLSGSNCSFQVDPPHLTTELALYARFCVGTALLQL